MWLFETVILCHIESVDSSVAMFMKDNFDADGRLDSIAPKARSNPTAHRRRNYLEFFKIFMNIATELSTLSMGYKIVVLGRDGCDTLYVYESIEGVAHVWLTDSYEDGSIEVHCGPHVRGDGVARIHERRPQWTRMDPLTHVNPVYHTWAEGAIESNCPSESKHLEFFKKFHVDSGGTVSSFR